MITALLTALGIASISLIGAFLFSHDKRLIGLERYIIPVAVGVFLSVVLFELFPEIIATAGEMGGVVVAIGFIGFYILSSYLHQQHHHHAADEDCERKNAATLLLIGDGIHNLADGFILGGAFLIDPTLGIVTGIGLALHEIPQEIVEFGVLIRAGYTRTKAAFLNFLSASSIVVGTAVVLLISEQIGTYVWVLVALAAGSLLYIATGELLPRVHSNLPRYNGVWPAASSIILGFVLMTGILIYAHDIAPHEHAGEHKALPMHEEAKHVH